MLQNFHYRNKLGLRRRQFNRVRDAVLTYYKQYIDDGNEKIEYKDLYTYDDVSDVLYDLNMQLEVKIIPLGIVGVINIEERKK